MKKFLTLMLAALMAFCLFGCSSGSGETTSEDTYNVVFLADLGSIYDGGFNEHSFYGIKDYCEEKGLKYTYLQPAGNDDASRVTIFEQAVNQMKAEVLVAVGFLWDAALCQQIPNYPDVKVIFVDADDLYNIDYDYDGVDDSLDHQDNLAMITFAEQDCGFMAGYATVMDGYTKLGFFGGMAVPAVIRFGYGWLEGAEAAAKELGLEDGAVECKYYYTGTFDASPDQVTFVSNWYTEGTEVVFSCGGTIVNSVITAAHDGENRKIVGVDTDEYYTRAASEGGTEPLIITSAMKSLENTIYDAVAAAYAGGADWARYTDAGLLRLGAKESAAIIAPYRAENWNTFTQEQYDAVNATVIELHDTLSTDTKTIDEVAAGLTKVTVSYIEK